MSATMSRAKPHRSKSRGPWRYTPEQRRFMQETADKEGVSYQAILHRVRRHGSTDARHSELSGVYGEKSCGRWAREQGVAKKTIYNRFRRKNQPGPEPCDMRKLFFEGKHYTEWAEELGVRWETIRERIRVHGSPYTPPKSGIRIEGKTIREWATELKLNRKTIEARIKRWGDPRYRRPPPCE